MGHVDHLVVGAATLDEGADWVADRLGVRPGPGGRHELMGTHNMLLGLGPQTYLEVIAIDPAAPPPGRVRWFGLDARSGPPRLSHWVMRVPDLDAALARAPRGAGLATDLARGDYLWRFAVTGTGGQPFDDSFPALIEWLGPRHPAADLPDSGARLLRLDLHHPRPAALAAALDAAAAPVDPRIAVTEGAPALGAAIVTSKGEQWLA